VAVLAVAGFGLAAAPCSASAAALLPTPSLPSLPSLPVPSLPLPTLPSLPVPTVLPTSLPTLPLPLPSPTGLIGGPGGGPGGVPVLFPTPASTAIAGGAVGSSVDGGGTGATPEVQTSVLGALLDLLGTPADVGVERPTLQHFDISAALASGRVATGKPAGGHPGDAGPAVLWGLAIACLLLLAGAGMSRHHRRRLSRLRVVAAAPLIVLAAILTVASAQGTLLQVAPSSVPSIGVVANAVSRSTPTAGAASTGSALFNRVLGFEAQIATTEVALHSPQAAENAAQLRDEHSLAVVLEATLQREYDFFAAVAQDRVQAAALVSATAGEPAAVRNAVTYDVQALQAQLAQQTAITQAAENNAASNTLVPTTSAAPPSSSATLMWPMNGVVTQGFGPSQVAIEPAVTLAGITYPHFHTGIDIASSFGTPVRAAADGVVALAGAETDGLGHLVGYGNYVVIAHGGNLITLYGHLNQELVAAGQAVHAGDVIGLEGSTGNSTGPHVHFELRVHGVPADPTGYVRQQ
jgi:murein DD-endopeptidase MepM/ murein hydrolase activator NlpD